MRQLSNLDFGNAARIVNLPDGTDPQHPATVAQLNAAVEGIAWKAAARVGTLSNLNLASPGATIDGVTMVAGDRVLVRSQTTASQNGIYVWNGAATAMTRALDASTFNELEGAAITVTEGTDAGVTFRQTQINGVIDTNNVAWTTFGTSAPAASDTTPGIVELATNAEVNAGSDTSRAVTPAGLAQYTGFTRKYAASFGDGSATTYTITHNLNTRDVHVNVYDTATYDEVGCNLVHATVNTVTVTVAVAPTSNALRAVVIG